MGSTNLSFDHYSKDRHLYLQTCDDEYTSKTNTSKGVSNIDVISPLSSPERENLNDAEERRKTLIIAATALESTHKCEWKNQDEDGIEHMEQVELIEEATQIEEALLDGPSSRLAKTSELPFHVNCDLGNGCQENEEEKKQLEENSQGLTGLALLAGSRSMSPRTTPRSPKTNIPRLSIEKTFVEYGTNLVAPVSDLIAAKKSMSNVETKEDGHGLSFVDGVGSQNGSSMDCSCNKQFKYGMPPSDNLLKSSYERQYASRSLTIATLEANVNTITTSLAGGKLDLEKDLKLKCKAFDNLLGCINENDSLEFILLETPQKSPRPNLEFQRQCFLRNSEGTQESWGVETLKNGDDGLIAESNEKDCKEWFREKLWCVLFENLSRAIDELYFLCDLQCDSEKMNEAILFLEEASQDFKELKSCVGVSVANGKKTEIYQQKPNILSSIKGSDTQANEKKPETQTNEKILEKQANEKKFETLANEKKYEILAIEKKSETFANEKKFEKKLETQVDVKNPETLTNKKKAKTPFEHQISVTPRSFVSGVEGKNQKHSHALLWEGLKPPRPKSQRDMREGDCRIAIQSSFISLPQNIFQTPTVEEREVLESSKNRRVARNYPESLQNRAASVISYRVDEEFPDNSAKKRKSSKRSSRSNFTGRLMRPTESSNIRAATNTKVKDKEKLKEKEKNELWSSTTKCSSKDFKQRRGWLDALTTPRWDPSKCQSFDKPTSVKNSIQSEIKSQKIIKRTGFNLSEDGHKKYLGSVNYTNSNCEHNSLKKQQHISSREGVYIPIQEEEKHVSFKQMLNLDVQQAEKMKCKRRDVNMAKEGAHERQDKHNVEYSQVQKQEKVGRVLDYRMGHKKSIIEQVQKSRFTKTNTHEYDIRHVEQRLAERLKQGADRRMAFLVEIKNRVALIGEEDKCSKAIAFGNQWEKKSFSNEQSSYKVGIPSSNVDDSYTGFTCISFFQKQAMKKRVKKIRLKLANKKVEFSEPPSGEEGSGIGSATIAGLARAKIGRWMEDLHRVQQAKDTSTTNLIVSEIAKYLERKHPELHAARQQGLLDHAATSIPLRQDPDTTLGLLQVQRTLLYLPANCSYFIIRNLLPPMVPMLLSSLEIFSTFGTFHHESSSKSSNQGQFHRVHESNNEKLKRVRELDVLREILEGLLCSTISIMGHPCNDKGQLSMQDDLADLLVASGLIHQLQNFFAVFSWQQGNQAPIPNCIILGLKLLEVLTGSKRKSLTSAHEEPINIIVHGAYMKQTQSSDRRELDFAKEVGISTLAAMGTNLHGNHIMNKQERDIYISTKGVTPRIVITQKDSSLAESTTLLVAAISETGLVGLPSLLIGILLQVDPFSQEQETCALPPNFNEVATSLLQVLNNVARLDLSLVQNKLALPDVCMEFYQLVSFLLTYCTSNWRTSTDEIAGLLLETMMLIGYAALLHPENQAKLRWGKNPTILHKMCNLPFAFFSDSKLIPILIGTLLAVCYGSDINRDVIQQQLSMEILLTFLKSSKTGLFQSPGTSHVTEGTKDEVKDGSGKAKVKGVTRGTKNSDVDFDMTPRSTQRIPLPKAFFTPSRNMLAFEKLGTYSTGLSTPKGTRRGDMSCCSTIWNPMVGASSPDVVTPKKVFISKATTHAPCSRLSRSLDSGDGGSTSPVSGPSSSANAYGRCAAVSPRLSSRNSETSDGSSIVVTGPLPTAFALRNRFPEGLWNFAEDFFSTSSWMGQLVKCL